jgi:hypothetical protein
MLTRLAAPILTGVLLLTAIVVPVAAADTALPLPQGGVILSVTGNIATTNAEGRADFDRAMLEALGVTTLTTWTPWTEGQVAFEGVLGAALLDAVGARGATIRAVAINDYEAEIPVSDFRNYRVLLATRMAGKQLRLRDKGPIWIVFPWSDHPELDDEPTRYKSVWQVKRLVIQ